MFLKRLLSLPFCQLQLHTSLYPPKHPLWKCNTHRLEKVHFRHLSHEVQPFGQIAQLFGNLLRIARFRGIQDKDRPCLRSRRRFVAHAFGLGFVLRASN